MNDSNVKSFGNNWIEVIECRYYQKTDDNSHRIRIRVSQISEIIDYDTEDKNRGQCKIVMVNGNVHCVYCDYDEICELVFKKG